MPSTTGQPVGTLFFLTRASEPVILSAAGAKDLMGAWASARNVAGPFRSHGAPGAGGETPAIVKPAA